MTLSQKADRLIEIIEKEGFQAYQVGGCVRDFLMNRECNDIDITTSAKPIELEKALEKHSVRYIETGLKHGTVTALFDGDTFEITTYRADGEYKDNRHPENVEFVQDVKYDLSRRDFTMNALAFNKNSGLIDLFGGKNDIDNKLIKAVGDPDKRFKEDALRIMRAIRFSSVLGFYVEEETQKAIFKNKELLKNVSAERLFSELSKLLLGKNVFTVLMKYRDVLAVIIPEIKRMFDFPQITKWHLYDVWEHTCMTVCKAPDDLALRLIMLLHDTGKPAMATVDDKGISHFKGHQRVSGEIADKVLKRFKASNELCDRVMLIIPIHDVHISATKKNVKKRLSQLGERGFFDLLAVKRADKAGQNPEMTSTELENLKAVEKIALEVINANEPYQIKDLAVNGFDLISLGFKGKEIGEALNELLEKVVLEKLENDKKTLLEYCKSKLS